MILNSIDFPMLLHCCLNLLGLEMKDQQTYLVYFSRFHFSKIWKSYSLFELRLSKMKLIYQFSISNPLFASLYLLDLKYLLSQTSLSLKTFLQIFFLLLESIILLYKIYFLSNLERKTQNCSFWLYDIQSFMNYLLEL